MRIIVVTGGLKSGKSTFMEYLRKYGHFTVDCDEIISSILRVIRLDKKTVLKFFFSNTLLRRLYLCIIIPIMLLILLIKCLFCCIKGHSLIFVEVPLLYEYKLNEMFFNIVIYTTKDIQMERIKKTGVSSKFLAMQVDMEHKRKMADWVVFNTGDVQALGGVVASLKDNALNLYQLILICVCILLQK